MSGLVESSRIDDGRGVRCAVSFSLPHGAVVVLEPGDIIGRGPRSALRIDDPRVSELHAYVSLRGAQLVLIALRGRMSVHGKPVTEMPLSAGLRVLLAGTFPIIVESVEVPATVLAIAGDGLEAVAVSGVMSLELEPRGLSSGFREDAAAVLWMSGNELRLRCRGDLDQSLAPGATFEVEGEHFSVLQIPLDELLQPETEGYGQLAVALEIAIYYDTVHIIPEDGRAVVIDGLTARIVSELAEIKSPVEWRSVAKSIWPTLDDTSALRSRWDQSMHRLRRKLREGKLRMDLVRASHGGLYELFLGPRDVVRNLS